MNKEEYYKIRNEYSDLNGRLEKLYDLTRTLRDFLVSVNDYWDIPEPNFYHGRCLTKKDIWGEDIMKQFKEHSELFMNTLYTMTDIASDKNDILESQIEEYQNQYHTKRSK